jgi:hypothetical protein
MDLGGAAKGDWPGDHTLTLFARTNLNESDFVGKGGLGDGLDGPLSLLDHILHAGGDWLPGLDDLL